MRAATFATTSILALLLAGTAWALDYRVRSGDTLAEIAQRFGVTVASIRAANGISGDLIHVGQVLRIPSDDDGGGDTVHVVAPGEALYLIALRYRVTAAEIMRANNLSSDVIQPGQRLRIPTTGGGGGATSSSASSSSSSGNTVHDLSAADLEVLARIVKGECPPDVPWEGKVAVAAVVLNRVERPGYPKTVRGVAHQPLQFSCYNANVRNRLYYGPVPQWCFDAARAAARGEDPSGGATHYFNPYLVRPAWARDMRFIRRIGHDANTTHDFYK